MKKILYIFVLFVLATACRSHIDNSKGTPLARVGDEYLYEKDISGLLPENMPPQDSLIWVRNYINNWVTTRLIIGKAKQNLRPEQLDFKSRLEKYKNSLIIYTYQTEIINQNLDTVVTVQEIERYYNEHKNDFVLLKNIVRVMYVVIDNDNKVKKKFMELFNLPDSVMMDSLESNCELYAKDYYLDTTNWIPFDELLKNIPIEVYNKELFLKNNRFINIKDKNDIYLVKFIDFKIKNDISPLALEEDNIKNILINKRKIDLVKELRDKLYDNAVRNDEIEIYTYD